MLAIKIALTLSFWGPPLLLAPDALLHALGFPVPDPPVFRRLLGAAYVALVVGYVGGYRAVANGQYPAAVVRMGIVSNGVAAVLLVGYHVLGAFTDWGVLARTFMAVSLLATAGITVGLAACSWRRHSNPGATGL